MSILLNANDNDSYNNVDGNIGSDSNDSNRSNYIDDDNKPALN